MKELVAWLPVYHPASAKSNDLRPIEHIEDLSNIFFFL